MVADTLPHGFTARDLAARSRESQDKVLQKRKPPVVTHNSLIPALPAFPVLDEQDEESLRRLDSKLVQVRDSVRGVARAYHMGFLLWGEGGTGKSYTVWQELEGLKAEFVAHNTRVTGRGLVDALERAPAHIHFIEDAETLLDDKRAWGLLRSALWSQSPAKPPERLITWTAHKTEIRFIFRGGIIIVSNVNLASTVPELRALGSRLKVLHLDVSREEMLALMKDICRKGHSYGRDELTAQECWCVAKFIIEQLGLLQRSLDVRLLLHGFKDYLQWRRKDSELHWHDLLKGRIQQTTVDCYKPRNQLKNEQSVIAREISRMAIPLSERISLWQKRTGNKGKSSFYRALNHHSR